MPSVFVLDPTGEPTAKPTKLSPRVADLNGKSLGFRVHWSRFAAFSERLEELLKQKYQLKDTPHIEGQPGHEIHTSGHMREEWAEFQRKSDTAIIGLAA
ncbi:MAG: hypothetical protein ABIH46_09455 [Chloroflexota bacterium]